jgi:ABC-type multidrug transport system ATPase subunit
MTSPCPPSSPTGLIECSIAFGGRPVLRSVSIGFPRASVTVVRGPSGAGKSTILHLLGGYLRPDAGEVVRSGTFGYLMQEELLFSSLSVADNVRIRYGGATGAALPADALDRALADLGIAHLADIPVSLLSGGERRRVELASILVTGAETVLLDEPTSGLDPSTRQAVFEGIWEAFAGRTIVVVTHDEQVPGLPAGARCLALIDGILA